MEDSDTTRGTGDLVNRSFSCPARSTRSVVSNLDQRLRLDHRKGGREWDYESEISGPQLTLREEPRPDTSGSKRAAMSRGKRFTCPSVHLAINFAHKAFLARKLSACRALLFFLFFALSLSKRSTPHSNFRSILPYSLSPPRLWTRSYCSTHEHKATRVLPESTLRPRLDWIGGAGG